MKKSNKRLVKNRKTSSDVSNVNSYKTASVGSVSSYTTGSVEYKDKLVDNYKDKNFNWCINFKYLYKYICEDDKKFSFYRKHVDVYKDFCYLKTCFDKLETLRTWTWKKFETDKNTSNGLFQIDKLDKKVKKMVQKHLQKLDRFEDVLYKVEINNHHRIWGIRVDCVFQIIWDDEIHSFYKHKNKNYTIT